MVCHETVVIKFKWMIYFKSGDEVKKVDIVTMILKNIMTVIATRHYVIVAMV